MTEELFCFFDADFKCLYNYLEFKKCLSLLEVLTENAASKVETVLYCMFWLSVAGVAVALSAGIFALLFSALADERLMNASAF